MRLPVLRTAIPDGRLALLRLAPQVEPGADPEREREEDGKGDRASAEHRRERNRQEESPHDQHEAECLRLGAYGVPHGSYTT